MFGRSVRAVPVHRHSKRIHSRVGAQERSSHPAVPATRATEGVERVERVEGVEGAGTWKDVVRALWAAAEGGAFAERPEQHPVYSVYLVDAVKRLNAASDVSGERLSGRLGMSLTWLAHRLGVMRELFYALPIDFARLSFRELVVMASLLAEASVADVRVLEAVSQVLSGDVWTCCGRTRWSLF